MSGLSHAEQAERLIAGGATLLQIRDKYATSQDLFCSVREVIRVAHASGATVIVNDRVDIAIAAGADGVHLGQDDMPPERARSLLGDTALIGYSTHTTEQAKEALTLPVDYLAIGPVFPTRTKPGADADVGLDTIKAVRSIIGDMPLVAIGGINGENAHSVIMAGADSAAMIGFLLHDPELTASRLRGLLEGSAC